MFVADDIYNPEKWKGTNHLGAIMESVRHSAFCAGDGTNHAQLHLLKGKSHIFPDNIRYV